MDNKNTIHGDILGLARKLHPRQIEWRRHLHSHPELSDEETQTTAYLVKELKALGLRIRPLNMTTGVIAELDGRSSSRTVAIRSDIDALPIAEQTGLPFASVTPGKMHACGHDVHMATVLGTAAVLAQIRSEFDGRVRFLFQPAEEMPPGGARPMIKNGALDKVGAIFGLHVDPHLKTGKIGLRDGPTMASVFDFDLTIHGRGGHAARPQDAVDAIVIAAEVVNSLQTIISRDIDPIDSAAITFGKVSGGVARNVIADRVQLTGTVRTLSPKLFRKIPLLLKRTVGGICKARGGRFTLQAVADYPVLNNDSAINALYTRTYTDLFGRSRIAVTDPVLGGEDFACYLQKVPGAMFRLGIRNPKIGADKPWHSPEFIVDEDAMYFGTSLLAAAAVDYLNGRTA